jgi:hypothetical protein
MGTGDRARGGEFVHAKLAYLLYQISPTAERVATLLNPQRHCYSSLPIINDIMLNEDFLALQETISGLNLNQQGVHS